MSGDAKVDPFVQEFLEGEDAASPSVGETVARLADALAPVAPGPALRERLFASLASGGRLHRFADGVAELLDLPVDQARGLLDGIDAAQSWSGSPIPGVDLFHLPGGPKVENCIRGFIKVERGGRFPHHRHVGDEAVLVVQGRYRDTVSGVVFGPGDIARMTPGTEHELVVEPGPTLIYLAVVHKGVGIGERIFKPGDPDI